MDEWKHILKDEFAGKEGSFLMTLRGEGKWSKTLFLRLFNAMVECCKANEGDDSIERWIADGFWYLSWYVKQEAEEFGFNTKYYTNAITNLDHLAFWLFQNQGRSDGEFEPLNEI